MRMIPIIGLALTGLASGAATAQTEVFTLAGLPVTNVPDHAAVFELDAPARLDKRLSDGLPADQAAAAKMVQQRLHGFKKAYGEAYRGLLRAWRLGVERVPAVVVDGEYVVYGEPDVQAALTEIRAAARQEERP